MIGGADARREDATIFMVVVNHEEQYSIWPADRELPLGWRDAGKHGHKAECHAYIEEVWTDMRPLSLRKKIKEMERERRARRGLIVAVTWQEIGENLSCFVPCGEFTIDASATTAIWTASRRQSGRERNVRYS